MTNLPSAAPAFVARHWQKLLAATLWLAALFGYSLYAQANQLTPFAAVQLLVDNISGTVFGPFVYILAYTLRPLIFFPSILLTLAGGFLFGPLWGVVYTIIGSNASTLVAYLVGRSFGLNTENSSGLLQRYTARLRQNSFETVLVMRFIFLPYDLVSYVCGFLRIDWRGFLLATLLGTIPGTISFVSIGASIEGDLANFTPRLDVPTLAVGAVMFIISLALSRHFRRRESKQTMEIPVHDSAAPQ